MWLWLAASLERGVEDTQTVPVALVTPGDERPTRGHNGRARTIGDTRESDEDPRGGQVMAYIFALLIAVTGLALLIGGLAADIPDNQFGGYGEGIGAAMSAAGGVVLMVIGAVIALVTSSSSRNAKPGDLRIKVVGGQIRVDRVDEHRNAEPEPRIRVVGGRIRFDNGDQSP